VLGGGIPGYELGNPLFRSLHAETWRARDSHGDDVVIKCYAPGVAPRDALIAFTSRAISAASLDHPNVAPLRDRGKSGAHLFTVRNYFAGGSLNEVGSSLHLGDKLQVGIEIGRALEHAHRRGLVHGAVKPTNVVFLSRERPVLVDFALVPGAPSTDFEPPPQPAPATTDPRTDQYSLAALVSWLLLGRVASAAETISEDERLHKALRRALAPAPAERFRQLDELVGALEAALAHSKHEDNSEPSNVRVERLARMLRVQITGNWTPQTVEACAREIDHAMGESGALAIGYLFGSHSGCHSTAIEALAELHRRHRPRLRRVGFVSDTPQARGASVLIGSRVEGLAWKTFSSVDLMDAWLREGSGE
jgi:serine/threonine protein kinase